MEPLDLYRSVLTGLACMSIGVNLTLAVMVLLHKREQFFAAVWFAYSLTAALTCTGSAYFRLRDAFTALPFNPGDVTAISPNVGFLIAGILGVRTLARLVGKDQL